MIQPIKRSEIKEAKCSSLPEEVIQSVNDMIVKNWNGSQAKFKQKDLIEQIMSKGNMKITRESLFSEYLLDFEDAFRREGWKIVYDGPGYNETYDAFFIFS